MNEYQPPMLPMLPTKQVWAKYDYDPSKLSPNVDGEQVELSFRQGDRLTIYGDVDKDGFFYGELKGLKGLVPSNFVTDKVSFHLIHIDSQQSRSSEANFPPRHVIAKFDYDAQQSSPNVDGAQVELSFKQGDRIRIYGEMDEDGFFFGELNGVKGLVPSNYLKE